MLVGPTSTVERDSASQGADVSERTPSPLCELAKETTRGTLNLHTLSGNLKVQAILENTSKRPLEYRDVLRRHNNELGYPWMSLNLRNNVGEFLTIPDLGTKYWSPYLLTDHVFDFEPIDSLERLDGGERVEVTVKLRDLMRGLPDHVRQEATEAKVSFEVPLSKNLESSVWAETDWFSIPPELKSIDLLEGGRGLGTVYAD